MKEGSQFILYCVSQNRFSVRHPIQSEKYGEARSYMSTGLFGFFKVTVITMNKSLNILFIYIKKGQTDNFSKFKR